MKKLLEERIMLFNVLTIVSILAIVCITFMMYQTALIFKSIEKDYPTVIIINVDKAEKDVEKEETPKTKVKAEKKEEPTKSIEKKETPETKVKAEKVEKKEEPKVDKNAYLLAQIIHAEANGEPYNGKLAVGNVVMNRVESNQFPDTIKEVIFQKGQFQPVSNGSIYDEPGSESLKAANEVLGGKKIIGDQALYFYNPSISTSDWIFSRETVMTIGNHRFAY